MAASTASVGFAALVESRSTKQPTWRQATSAGRVAQSMPKGGRRVRLDQGQRQGCVLVHSKANALRRRCTVRASAATEAAEAAAAAGEKPILLEVKGLEARVADTGMEILRGIDLVVRAGEIHAIMGKNGSGKSTLSKVLVGHPGYEVTAGEVKFKGEDLLEKEPEERAHAGLFLSFQSPVEIPGVSNTDFLRMACNARRKARGDSELDPLEFYAYVAPKLEELNMDYAYLNRNVNEGFSGGEKKRNEILQLAVLDAEVAILDEIDSGLDVDALRDVAKAINALRRPDRATIMITHYQRLLDYITPDFVHIVENGQIIKTGDRTLAKALEEGGYAAIR